MSENQLDENSAKARVDVITKIRKLSKTSIDLAWTLGQVAAEKSYRDWGFASLADWIRHDIANPDDRTRNIMSRAYAFMLAKVGICFYAHREKINELAANNLVGIKQLIDMSNKCERGLPLADAMRVLEGRQELPDQFKDQKHTNDPENIELIKSYVKKGDVDNFNATLMLYAVMNGCKNLNEALNDLVLSNYVELLSAFDSVANENWEKYRDPILNSKFYCKLCKQIPTVPNLHHLLPVSRGHGIGPLVLLCEKCHIEIVQPNFKHYFEKWTGWKLTEYEKYVNDLIQEHGKVPEDMLNTPILYD